MAVESLILWYNIIRTVKGGAEKWQVIFKKFWNLLMR